MYPINQTIHTIKDLFQTMKIRNKRSIFYSSIMITKVSGIVVE